MSETIYFYGNKYSSAAEMPSDIRQLYEKLNLFFEDEDRDGVPDIVQSGGLSRIKETINMIKDIAQISSSSGGFEPGQISIVRVTDTNIFINGKEYGNPSEMPDYIRQEYERIIRSARDGSEDIYDESWRQTDREDYFKPHDDEIFNQQIKRQVSNLETPIETVESTSRFLFIGALTILILGLLTAVWILFF